MDAAISIHLKGIALHANVHEGDDSACLSIGDADVPYFATKLDLHVHGVDADKFKRAAAAFNAILNEPAAIAEAAE